MPDVDPTRIGGIGLSVGGELMLEAAAETKDLAAVVSEGAGARTRAEEVDTEGLPTVDRWLGERVLRPARRDGRRRPPATSRPST